MHCCRIVNVIKNKNIKNSLGAGKEAKRRDMPSACFDGVDSLFVQVRQMKSCLRISGDRRAPRVELWRR